MKDDAPQDAITELLHGCEFLIAAFAEGSDYRTGLWWHSQPVPITGDWRATYRAARAQVEQAAERVGLIARQLGLSTSLSSLLDAVATERVDEAADARFVTATRVLREIILDAKAADSLGEGGNVNGSMRCPALHSTELDILMELAGASSALTQDTLSDKIGASRATVSRYIKELRAKGLTKPLRDRRGEVLTEEGHCVAREAIRR